MTARPPARGEVEAFFARLKDKDFKATPQRKAIAEAVFGIHGHFTADELYRKVKAAEPLTGRVTVYRTLERLVEAGMVQALATEKTGALYEHTYGHEHHDHVVCRGCGAVRELLDPAVEKALQRVPVSWGWKVLGHDVSIKALCPKCSKSK